MAGMTFDLANLKNLKLTKEQQQYLVVGILAIAGSVYGYWSFLLTPLNKSIVDLTKQLKDKQESIEKARRIKSQWEEYTQRLSRVQSGMQYISRRLPPDAGVNVELQRLIKMTLEGGVEMAAYGSEKNAGNKSEFPGYKKNIANLILVADFHRLGNFLSRLSGEDIVYNIEDLQLAAAPENKLRHSIGAGVKLVTYTEISAGGKP